MRSKWRRESSSRAARSPCCPSSTRRRSGRVGSLTRDPGASVDLFVIPPKGMPGRMRPLNAGREADAAFARKALDVDHARKSDCVAAVLGFESMRTVDPVGECLLELRRGVAAHEGAHDLASVEADLDSHPGLVSHG